MNIYALLRIFMPGGIINHDNLMAVVTLSKKFGIRNVQFGLRQDININVEHYKLADLKLYLDNLNFDYEFNTDWSRNIVTSYVANGVFPSESWLTEGSYLNILDTFDYVPKMRINIVDSNQGLVPLFTGHFNFIASKTNNYWYLYLDVPKWFEKITLWPLLIYSDDINMNAHHLETLYNDSTIIESIKDTNAEQILEVLVKKINDLIPGNTRNVKQELKIPFVPLPYYEGVNKTGNKYWLGIYKRSYLFTVEFLEAIGELCFQSNIGKICITPWRSILIKEIKESDWLTWIKLLGIFSINIRHSSLELNWRIPDFDSFAVELKKYLVNEFDKNDIRTYGLTFAIRTKKVDLDAIIVIEKVAVKSMFKTKQVEGNYNIYYTKNFEVNQKEYITYVENVSYNSLPKKLEQLTNMYYQQQSLPSEEEKNKKQKEQESYLTYRCKNCFTTYDQKYGDKTNNVAPGTPFERLSDHFVCSVCDAPKSDFEPVEPEKKVA